MTPPAALPPAGILAAFGLPARADLRPDREHVAPGSPERTIDRAVLRDGSGGLWLSERIHPEQTARRETLGELLEALAARLDAEQSDTVPRGLVPAYRRAAEGGSFVLRAGADRHMLQRFVPGAPLPRPEYLDDGARGAGLARAIAAVQRAGAGLTGLAGLAGLAGLPQPPQPDLPAYRDRLFATIDRRRPELSPRLAGVRAALEGLPELLARQPLALAHGDLHPQNVIWAAPMGQAGQMGQRERGDGQRPVLALIDWEFAGVRPVLYDAANCLGCCGFEEPSGLGRGFALAFVRGLGLPPELRALLPDMALASRLGWLAEWLRKADAELLQMELDYLDILLGARAGLARLWAQG